MPHIQNPVEPFGKVNLIPQPDGSIEVIATVLMVNEVEGARTGLALDASASMKKMYGVTALAGSVFGKATAAENAMEPVGQQMAGFLANFSSSGTTQTIYWAVNNDGSGIEEVGPIAADTSASVPLVGPKKLPWGKGTKLLPPVKYFAEQAFPTNAWTMVVIVTDGKIDDLDDVKAYSLELGKKIGSGARAYMKLVLIGMGTAVDEAQMEELDNLFEGKGIVDSKGEEIDLWDHRLIGDIKKFEDIFSEVVTNDNQVAEWAKITDNAGKLVQSYTDGMPALLRFTLPKGATSFTVTHPGGTIVQGLS